MTKFTVKANVGSSLFFSSFLERWYQQHVSGLPCTSQCQRLAHYHETCYVTDVPSVNVVQRANEEAELVQQQL